MIVTVKVRCIGASMDALHVIDSNGVETWIPQKFVTYKTFDDVTGLMDTIDIPLWLASDRGFKHEQS